MGLIESVELQCEMRETLCEASAMEMGGGESVELQRWRMVCDVDVDVGRSMVFGSEEMRE